MSNFRKLYEAIIKEGQQDFDPSVEAAFRAKPSSFWKDLRDIARGGNSKGFAMLLGVSEDQIRKWPHILDEFIKKIEQKDSEENRNEMLPTGVNIEDDKAQTVGGTKSSPGMAMNVR